MLNDEENNDNEEPTVFLIVKDPAFPSAYHVTERSGYEDAYAKYNELLCAGILFEDIQCIVGWKIDLLQEGGYVC